MMFGAAGLAISLCVIGGCLSGGSKKGAIAATDFIFVYATAFAIGWVGHYMAISCRNYSHQNPCRDERLRLHYLFEVMSKLSYNGIFSN